MLSKPSPVKNKSTELHVVVATFLILGAIAAAALGGYLIRNPIQTPPQSTTVSTPCPTTNSGNTGSATAKSGQGGTSVAHSGHGDTVNAPPATKK